MEPSGERPVLEEPWEHELDVFHEEGAGLDEEYEQMEEGYYEFLMDYAGRIYPDQGVYDPTIPEEYRAPLAVELENDSISFDPHEEEIDSYWGIPYDFDFSSDYFFAEFCIFIFLVYFFLSPILALFIFGLYLEYFEDFSYVEHWEDERPFDRDGSDIAEESDDEDRDEVYFDEDYSLGSSEALDNPFIWEFQDFHQDDFSDEDLADFYFFL